MNIEKRNLKDLKYAEYNPRKLLQPEDPEYQSIARSIDEFGYVDPIIINSDNTIIGGHQRVTVMLDKGYSEVQVVVLDLPKQQEKAWTVRNGKPVPYEPTELKAARAKLEAHLAGHVPEKPYTGAVRLITKWCFLFTGKHQDGEYKITPPDTDNLQKLLKDVMTRLGYWKDDALVASEIIEKFWAKIPGIYIAIEELR